MGPALNLDPETIVIFGVDLSQAVDITALSSAEQARAGRFHDSLLAQRYRHAHVGMRGVLGRCLGRDPAALDFVAGIHGRPELADAGGLRFSLTHAGERALVAIASGRLVGVDIEAVDGRSEDAKVAARFLSAAETAALAVLSQEEFDAAFCAAWTRTEAVLKCLGLGLAGLGRAPAPGDPTVCMLEVGPGWAAAVAAPGRFIVACQG